MRVTTLPRTLLIVITLVLTVQPSRVAQAAPARDSTVFTVHLAIRMADNPLCAGRDYPVTVIPEEQLDISGQGQSETRTGGFLGLPIDASVADTAIATVFPKSMPSGWDVDAPVPLSAQFTLHTKKAGSTNVFFEAYFTKGRLGGNSGQYVGPVIPIQVVNCKYKVTMTFRATGGTEGYDSRGSGRVEGTIVGESGGDLKGTANQGYWDMHAFSPCCSHTITSNSPSATLSGTLSADGTSLSLHADFSPISAADTSVSHPVPIVGSVTGTSTANLQIPPLDVNLSASGDSVLQEVSIPFGDTSLQAAIVITATPITSQ